MCDAQSFQAWLDIRVLDQIGLPPSVRSGARATTGAVLDRVGISTRWRVCDGTHRSAECSLPFSASEISIRMLARPANPHQTGLAVSIVKVADGMGVYSVVFHDRIVDARRRASCKPP